MSDTSTLLSFYPSRKDADKVLQKLRRGLFRRAALIGRSAGGSIHTDNISARYGARWGAVGGLVLGLLVASVTLGAGEVFTRLSGYFSLGAFAVAGALVGWLAVRAVGIGVDDAAVKLHAGRLVAGETVVLVQAPPASMDRTLRYLRAAGESQPSIFALHPPRVPAAGAELDRGEHLSAAQLAAHARSLASSHKMRSYTGRDEPILKQLDFCEAAIDRGRRELAEASRLEQHMSASAEWILDNAHIVKAHIADVRLNLTRKFCRELPVLTTNPHRGTPRIYAVAMDLILYTDGQLDRHVIADYLDAYQSTAALTIGELWAAPLMLRIALVGRLARLTDQVTGRLRDRERAGFWANRLLAAARRDRGQLFTFLAELAREQPEPSEHFAFHLTEHLCNEEAALMPVQSWLELKLTSALADGVLLEQARNAADQASIAAAITSLRQLSLLDWREIFEDQSRVDQTLSRDPAGCYSRMDFPTRDRYRHAVEELARGAGVSEDSVARSAISLASAATPAENPRLSHVGFYLVDEGRRRLAAILSCRESRRHRLLQRINAHPAALYLSAVLLMTAATVAAVVGLDIWAGERWLLLAIATVFAALPSSQLALQVVNYLVTRILPPRLLPKMSFEKTGIPDEFRTLVVVPMLLINKKTVRDEVEKLEIRYLANPDANLLFSLFSDFADADEVHKEGDAELLQLAIEELGALNLRYGANRFYLFHRNRSWSESEQAFIGWERKRGKLEMLNRLLNGEPHPKGQKIVHVGDADLLANVRFVITLDSDTQLPRDTARRMIETMAHPLNRPPFDAAAGAGARAYTIIQPRIRPSLPSANATPFSRLFNDPVGTDPYTKAVSDVYQDLAGEGAYIGKGIYDPRAFHNVLAGRFPEQTVLSHDLIEGAHLRVAFTSDIELFDDFPPDYLTHISREQRWIRGDWQIADWCTPRVPAGDGGRASNPLSVLNRWKIFDNLRRSLVPAASILFLVTAWMLSAKLGAAASVLIGLLAFFPSFAERFSWVTSPRGAGKRSWRELAHSAVRSLAEAALMPYQAGVSMEAIVRVAYRRLISRRKLLQWTTAQMTRRKVGGRLRRLLVQMGVISLFSLALGAAVWQIQPDNLPVAIPFLVLWLVSPAIGWRLSAPPRSRPRRAVAPADRAMLRDVARRTWRYFTDFVGPESAWLPPDNYQTAYGNSLAMRTSPTNIGLWILSALGAHDFGYLTGDEVIRRAAGSFETLNRLEKYNGHLLNWYDLRNLAPLEPRYVSTVDSGNLLACLWTFDSGVQELLDAPILGPRALHGLHDTLGVLCAALKEDDRFESHRQTLEFLESRFRDPPEATGEIIRRIRSAAETASILSQALGGNAGTENEPAYWAQQVDAQLSAWITLVDRYLPWVEMLQDGSQRPAASPESETHDPRRWTLQGAPSLRQLAAGKVSSMQSLPLAEDGGSGAPFVEAFSRSKWLAGEMLGQAEELLAATRELAAGMNMRFLYDDERRLFTIGFNVREQRFDPSYYDLLASEARLGSLVAIARGDVPAKHWLSLARPYGAVGRRSVLLSWSGTMFEYLMPLLLQRSFQNSLLDQACREAVFQQIAYGRKRGVPWGVSESAYSDLDANKAYQYQAFGVPGLGLKRGLGDDLVVAPYASMLALAIAPAEVVGNLKHLSRLNLRGDYGFYEAIDFTRQRRRGGERGLVVETYMAHHQAMSFLAIDNWIHDGVMQRRFHRDPRVRSSEPLLYERVPATAPLYQGPERDHARPRLAPEEIAPSSSSFDTPHTVTPKTQLLSNGRYALMLTNAGGGYSRWGDLEITRWRADSTCDRWGTFCYIRDLESGRVWSNGYQPVGGAMDNYAVRFTIDRAEIRRSDDGIETESAIIVAPEDDVEIRHISLINRAERRRELEVTSYVELALAPHSADRQHPAFSKLFVQTESIPRYGALVGHRRGRSPEELPIWAAHLLAMTTPAAGPMEFETDRKRFIGRGRTTADAIALGTRLTNTEGSVLDPIFSLRRKVVLDPGQRIDFSLILAAAGSRDDVLALVEKYAHPQAVARELDLVWSHAQLELRRLHIEPDDARRFQELASPMLYPSSQLRPGGERLRQNRLGQSRLWPYGISGDLPIAVVTIGESADMTLVRQVLQAHTYWRLHGLRADLLILNEEVGSYEQPLKEQLRRLIQAHSMHTGVDQPGGVFLITLNQIPEEDQILMLAAAHVVLVAARGPLAQQLGTPAETAALPGPLRTEPVEEEPSAELPFMTLPYFNGLGGFTADGREYAIYLGPDRQTPAPWVNVLANPTFGTLVSESGSGFTWYGNSQQNRLTGWSNDPVSDLPSEAIYIRDEETGTFWTPTPLPVRELDAYRVRHGAGYTVFEHNSHAIEQELTTFVPVDDNGGEPVSIRRLKLRNDSSRTRRLSVTFYVEWTLGGHRETTASHVATAWDRSARAIVVRNHYRPDYGERISFAALSPPPQTYTADRAEFLGRNGTPAAPAALSRVGLSGRVGAGLDPCAALQAMVVDLAPGETTELICLLGEAGSLDAASALVRKFRDGTAVEAALTQTKQWWNRLLDTVQIETPAVSVNFLCNRWLVYQTLSCRIWGRSGFYQSGGAFGFRDQLQDVLALLYAAPEVARKQLLLAASRQFREGDVQHWWHPESGMGVRSRCSDDLLWLPHAVAQYVQVTGDVDILQEKIPFLAGQPLEEGEHEVMGVPQPTEEKATLHEHCRLAIERGLTAGPHGLPLIGIGDWNDGLNRVGVEGKGESVWLAWFLIDVLRRFTEVMEHAGLGEQLVPYRKQAERLAEAVEKGAWDGKWYRRGYFDDGTTLGSSENREAWIDSLPQSWAILSGAADPTRARQALESAYEHLVIKDERLVLLFTPPFDKMERSPGYIQAYPPGVRENGGQYTHGALWLAMAFARLGDGDRSHSLLSMLNPIEHARKLEDVDRYVVEPYVVAADIYRLPGRVGQGGWTWYTGSAGWMYRAWLEEVLGLKIRGSTMRIDPVLPSSWEKVAVRYRHGRAVYEITIENPDGANSGVAWVEMDGRRLEDGIIPLEKDLTKHRVRIGVGPR